MNKIYFFDIDETVFHTFSKIKVIKDNKVIKLLDNQSFNKYKLNDGESFDFSEFRSSETFYQTSKPIMNVVKMIKRYIQSLNQNDKLIFLTARADFNDKEKFLDTFRKHGIDVDNKNVYIERSGNLTYIPTVAERKKRIIEKYLQTGIFNKIKMYDDDMNNLKSFKDITNELNYNSEAIKVSGNGRLKKVCE